MVRGAVLIATIAVAMAAAIRFVLTTAPETFYGFEFSSNHEPFLDAVP